MSVRSLSSKAERDEAVRLLARILAQPSMPEEFFKRDKARIISGLREALTRGAVATLLGITQRERYTPIGRLVDERVIVNAMVALLDGDRRDLRFIALDMDGLPPFYRRVYEVSREIGPVNILGAFNYSPNFFGRSGDGFYLEAGADWKTGVWDLTVGARFGYQWIQRNAVFGTPDYAWWSVGISREFAIPNIGTLVASVGYYDTSINKSDCIYGTSQNICSARALASIAFRF